MWANKIRRSFYNAMLKKALAEVESKSALSVQWQALLPANFRPLPQNQLPDCIAFSADRKKIHAWDHSNAILLATFLLFAVNSTFLNLDRSVPLGLVKLKLTRLTAFSHSVVPSRPATVIPCSVSLFCFAFDCTRPSRFYSMNNSTQWDQLKRDIVARVKLQCPLAIFEEIRIILRTKLWRQSALSQIVPVGK